MSGMITAAEPIAVEEGAKVLMAGGNAVDAAVTCALVQGIVNPHNCGVGGYALLNLYHPGEQTGGQIDSENPSRPGVVLDAPALAGARVTPGMWEQELIRPNPDGWGFFLNQRVNDIGYQSICAPGTVAALDMMLQRWGTLSWREVVAPAARIAEEGFLVDRVLADKWTGGRPYPEATSSFDRLTHNAEASRIYLKSDGRAYGANERLANPDYAKTLCHLGEHGAADFYQGELAQRMVADLTANDSFVTAADLSSYQLREMAPVIGSYRGYTIATAAPPHGGPTLLAILNILEGYDLAALGHNSADYIYHVAMSMKASFADRNAHMGDPDYGDVPLAWMIDKARAGQWRAHIDAGHEITVSYASSDGPDTTQVTVVDDNGVCVSLTHSLGASSGVITPGLGFMYNNSMTNFHPIPGHPNSIAPGKSRTTGMAPTIVYKDGNPIVVIGAPGANRIITSIAQVLLNVLDFGMDISNAVLVPRIDCQGDLIRCQLRIPEYVCEQVRKRHPITRLPDSHGGLARVHAIAIDAKSGALTGAADTGGAGMALAV